MYQLHPVVEQKAKTSSPAYGKAEDAPSESIHSVHIVKPKTGTFVNMLAGTPLIFFSVTFGFYANEVLALETRTMYRHSQMLLVRVFTFVNMLAGTPFIFFSVTFGFYANEVLALETRTLYRHSQIIYMCRSVMN
uniref:Uncharacterized protein n=1 Tax=Xenopus tropicalis TaxID=8364 RepID=A0A310SUC8_XENTR